MEEELQNNFKDVSVNLIKGGGGIFDVTVDNVLIFSKGRDKPGFPDAGEVTKLIRSR